MSSCLLVGRVRRADGSSGTAGINPAVAASRTANRRELLDRAAKSEFVAALGEVFKATNAVVVAHYSGLTVAQMQNSASGR